MAIRNIRLIGDDILLKPCKEIKKVDARLKELIEDMIETMRDANGVGLAAPQVGVLKRLTVIEAEPGEPYVFINPVIVESSGEQLGYEGCLSIPGKTGMVRRPEKLRVKAYDADMQEFELEVEGLFARAVCHECDHLDGKLYLDLVEGDIIESDEEGEE